MAAAGATLRVLGAMTFSLVFMIAASQSLPAEFDKDRHPTFHTGGAVLIKHGTVLTGTHGTLVDTDVLIQNGRISRIGKGIEPPAGIKIVDATGRFVSPGIVNAHSHRAIDDSNEGADSITSEVRISDVLNTDSLSLFYALASGMTTLMVLHGSANPIGGQCLVIKSKWERPAQEAVFKGAPHMIKFALGENPKRPGQSNQRFPSTRMGVEAVYRRAFNDAMEYMREWDEYRKSPHDAKVAPPRRDLRLEAIADILRGKTWVQCHSYRQDEMLMMARLSQEFHFHLCLQHALEGYKIAPELAKAGIPVSMFGDGFAYKLEVVDSIPMATAICDRAGVLVSVNTDTSGGTAPITQDAARSMRYGVSEDHALRMVTINPAIELGVQDRVGSIDVGKDGDIAIWQGHPLSNYTKCVMTFIEGEVYFERRDAFKVDSHSMATTRTHPMAFDPDLNVLPKSARSYLIAGATVHPISGPDISNGEVWIKDGIIQGVGTDLNPGAGTVRIDGKGLEVYPGLIDAGSKLGIDDIGEVSASFDSGENGDFKPDVIALHSINPESVHFPKARFNGITSAATTPDGGLIAGQSALIRTFGLTTESMDLGSPAGLDVYVPQGPNPASRFILSPEEYTRQESGFADRVRSLIEYFNMAKRYGDAKLAGERVQTDVKLEAMLPYMKGLKPIMFHADDERSIRQAVLIKQRFGLKAVVEGGTDAWKVAKLLKDNDVSVIYRAPIDANPSEVMPNGDLDPYDAPYATPSLLHDAGVRFCFMTDSFDMAMDLPFDAGRSCAFGLSHAAAMKALTLDAATILGIGDRLGSLDRGKIANLFVVAGDPLELTSQLRYLFINGQPVRLESHYTDLYKKYLGRLTK